MFAIRWPVFGAAGDYMLYGLCCVPALVEGTVRDTPPLRCHTVASNASPRAVGGCYCCGSITGLGRAWSRRSRCLYGAHSSEMGRYPVGVSRGVIARPTSLRYGDHFGARSLADSSSGNTRRGRAQPVGCLLTLMFYVLRVNAVDAWCLTGLQLLDNRLDFLCCEIVG